MTTDLLRRLWPVVAVVLLLGLASVAASHSSLEFTRLETSSDELPELPDYLPPTVTPPPGPARVAAAEQSELPGWITVVAVVAGVAVLAVVVGLLLRGVVRDLRRRRDIWRAGSDGRRSSARTTRDVVDALDAGLVELSDDDVDPRRAVIACWVRLEQAAAAAGLPRQVGDTPTDLVTRLLRGRTTVSADVLAAFAQVYREARYATRTVDERMRSQARSALQRLRAELTDETGGIAGTDETGVEVGR
ncbi:DUF4129 domain-containing protein [Micromonospora sp. NPDC003197]